MHVSSLRAASVGASKGIPAIFYLVCCILYLEVCRQHAILVVRSVVSITLACAFLIPISALIFDHWPQPESRNKEYHGKLATSRVGTLLPLPAANHINRCCDPGPSVLHQAMSLIFVSLNFWINVDYPVLHNQTSFLLSNYFALSLLLIFTSSPYLSRQHLCFHFCQYHTAHPGLCRFCEHPRHSFLSLSSFLYLLGVLR